MNKKNGFILVTGAAGFIGFHVVKRLLSDGLRVIGLDNLNDYYSVDLKKDRLIQLGVDISDGTCFSDDGNLIFLKGDISSQECFDLLDSYDVINVIHLAAQAGVRYSLIAPNDYIHSNLIGFQRVLDYCVKREINLIYASSSSVYGKSSKEPFRESESCVEPESLYAATKRSNELVAHAYFKTKRISSVGLRFFTVYGPWGRPDMAPMLFAKAILKSEQIEVYNFGNQLRDFTYIDDIVYGILLTLEALNNSKISGAEILNIGNGKPVQLMTFIETLEACFGRSVNKKYIPEQLGDVQLTYADTTKLFELTGYESRIPLGIGLKAFANWYLEYFNKENNESH
jgi:UDP-glucuronate 4-epimerase